MDVNHIRTLYEQEHHRRLELVKSTMAQVPVLVMLVSAAVLLMQIDYVPKGRLAIVSHVIFASTLIVQLRLLYLLLRAFNNLTSGYEYAYIPCVRDQRSRYETILAETAAYFLDHEIGQLSSHESTDAMRRAAATQFDVYLCSVYETCADHNQAVNDIRSAYLFKARRVVVIISMLIAGLAFTNLFSTISLRVLC